MGNRAVITTRERKLGIYLHWNGGRDSVEGFLKYCKMVGHRAPEKDCYGWARLCQVIGNFLGGTTSLGIDVLERLDCNNGDNGVYIIEDWEIVDREFAPKREQANYPLEEILKEIDEKQPVQLLKVLKEGVER